jgi:Tfp pilus assembly protein PilV
MKSNSQGTTLLETLVALVILAGGLVALAQFVAYSSANDLRSRIRIEMAQIADSSRNTGQAIQRFRSACQFP